MDLALFFATVFGTPPPSWTWYDIFRDFVLPALVGVVGFGGVIVTLRSNARLARDQHDREISLREKVITNGLLVEFTHAREVLKVNREFLDETGPEHEIAFQRIPPRISTINSAADLGLLEETKIKAVFDGFMAIERYRTRLLSACEEGSETSDHLVSIQRSIALNGVKLTADTTRLLDISILTLEGTRPVISEARSAKA